MPIQLYVSLTGYTQNVLSNSFARNKHFYRALTLHLVGFTKIDIVEGLFIPICLVLIHFLKSRYVLGRRCCRLAAFKFVHDRYAIRIASVSSSAVSTFLTTALNVLVAIRFWYIEGCMFRDSAPSNNYLQKPY